ncbi:hypothetical protein INR49_023669 [Caranx melampygus]|nr:hypothetical protein INR49_032793 [Caranx melampygus]KAG7245103.1 hypothetical protein INR49_023669 [Caranx melampygus]
MWADSDGDDRGAQGGPHRGRAGKLTNSTVNGSSHRQASEGSQCWISLERAVLGNKASGGADLDKKEHKNDLSGRRNEILRKEGRKQ